MAGFGRSLTSGPAIKIGAYNVEWFLDVFKNPYTKDAPKPPKPRKEIERVARCIRTIDPDVMALEEVENEGVLHGMVNEFLPDKGYSFIAVDPTNSDRGQNLGVISRKPIVSMTSYRFQELSIEGDPRTWRFSRDLFRVDVRVTPDRLLHVFVVHLRSQIDAANDPHGDTHRLAEATGVRRIIGEFLKQDPDAWIALLGDFNDTPDSPPLKKLLDANPPFLLDAHGGMDAQKRATYLAGPHRSTFDYILANPALQKQLISGSAKVLANEVTDLTMLEGSDHSPVYASFRIGGL